MSLQESQLVHDGGYSWTDWPDGDGTSLSMSHTGIVLARGRLISGAAHSPSLVTRDSAGNIEQVVAIEYATELHDLTLVEEDDQALLWIADTGFKLLAGGPDLVRRHGPRGGQVLQVGLDGSVLRSIDRPPISAYANADWSPTAVAVDEVRHGGSGDIWVADGYGAGLVHQYAADGRYLATLSGEEGAGRFAQPHDLLVDRRGAVPELLVADRLNGRIQVYDLGGRFLRTLGDGLLPGPTQMAVDGDRLVVTDLLAGRVTILDSSGSLVAQIFARSSPPRSWSETPGGWPVARSNDGTLTRANLVPGMFHTPHGLAIAPHGTIYVSEFAVGGRIAVLTPD